MRLAALIALSLLLSRAEAAESCGGAQFIGWTNFAAFARESGSSGLVLASPETQPSIPWNELIVSWNVRGAATNGFSIEAQVVYPDHVTRWYQMGRWALDPAVYPRESVQGQRDEDGSVATDTLRLQRSGGAVRVRVVLAGQGDPAALRFLGLAFCDTAYASAAPSVRSHGLAISLEVPERSQADFPEGINAWCSPTAVSMLLAFWARELGRPGLDHPVPEVARGVDDPKWPGTGNWPFNMAFAGAQAGLRAYVARFSDVAELESWVASGIPVAISVSYGLLKGESRPGNGHLVVCAGFTESGDLVANDPGRKKVRQIYRRENLVKAWRDSHNTVYLIYPEDRRVPADPFGHWFASP